MRPDGGLDGEMPGQREPRRTGILMLAPSGWGRVWTGRHQLARRLARRYAVLWMTPAPPWREVTVSRRLVSRVTPAWSAAGVLEYEAPFWLPRIPRLRALDRRLFQKRLAKAEGVLRAQGVDKLVLYIWRPGFASALDLVPHDLSVYHINDDYSFSAASHDVPPSERRLIERVNRVVIHSPELLRRKGSINPETMFLPNGVDFDLYAAEWPEPQDLRDIPHPRVGYVGWLKRHLDWVMLLDLARATPDAHFVFIGPTSPHPDVLPFLEELRTLPNVHLLGGRPVDELPAYTRHIDVGIMPYVVNDYTRCIYPLKAHEYLAAGKPVVGTRLPSLELLADVVRLADGTDDWRVAVRAALDGLPSTDQDVAARQAVARAHDWDGLADELAQMIETAMP